MRRQPWGRCAVAPAILVVGLVRAGVPASTVLVAGVPMRGMHVGDQAGQHDHSARPEHRPHDDRDTHRG